MPLDPKKRAEIENESRYWAAQRGWNLHQTGRKYQLVNNRQQVEFESGNIYQTRDFAYQCAPFVRGDTSGRVPEKSNHTTALIQRQTEAIATIEEILVRCLPATEDELLEIVLDKHPNHADLSLVRSVWRSHHGIKPFEQVDESAQILADYGYRLATAALSYFVVGDHFDHFEPQLFGRNYCELPEPQKAKTIPFRTTQQYKEVA